MTKRRRRRRGSAGAEAFWGNTNQQSTAVTRIQPTSDPGAIPRSLGDPPLSPEVAAPQQLAIIYEEAVRAATALAAANDLLDIDEG
jgi:hypothetical protein